MLAGLCFGEIESTGEIADEGEDAVLVVAAPVLVKPDTEPVFAAETEAPPSAESPPGFPDGSGADTDALPDGRCTYVPFCDPTVVGKASELVGVTMGSTTAVLYTSM